MKRFLSHLIMFITVLSCSFAISGANSTTHALFEASKGDACKGANLSNADSAKNCDSGKATTKVEDTIKWIVNVLSVIVGIVAVIAIMINGLRFITSGGDSNTINSARNGVIYAIVGLIVAALAQVIVRFVITKLT